MRGALRKQFYLESAAGLTSITLLILALAWRNWIEIAFGLDPDRGSGLAELAVVVFFAAIALTSSLGAGWELRRVVASPRLSAGSGDPDLG